MSKQKAVIYCRVSKPNDTRVASLNTQEQECRKLAEREGYEVLSVFTERQSGAKLWEREELSQARDLIRTGQAQAFVTYDTDRLSRGGQAHLWVVVEEIMTLGAKFLCVVEPFEDTPEGRLMLSVRAYRAESERYKIKDRTMRGRRDLLNKGKIPGQGAARYGWDKVDHQYVINEKEAAVMRWVYQEIADGRSSRDVAAELTARGEPTPGQAKKRHQASSLWMGSNLAGMVRNPIYKGIYQAQVTGVNDKTGKLEKRPAKDHIKLSKVLPNVKTENSIN